jgi:hypothetical protein
MRQESAHALRQALFVGDVCAVLALVGVILALAETRKCCSGNEEFRGSCVSRYIMMLAFFMCSTFTTCGL